MKKALLTLISVMSITCSFAQNTGWSTAGNIGIGTTDPQFPLEIDAEIPYLKIRSTVYTPNPTVLTVKGGIIFNQENLDKTAAILEAIPPAYHVPGILFATKLAWNTPGPGTTDWYYRMFIHPNGNVGIGTINPDSKLAVNGQIHSTSVKVDMDGWADYVFKPTYKLPSLALVKTYIDQNSHLPEMPSEEEIVKEGLNLGVMNKLITKKIEELTLYLIEKDKQVSELQNEVYLLKQEQKARQSQTEQINQLKQQLDLISKALNKN